MPVADSDPAAMNACSKEAALKANPAAAIVGFQDGDDWYKPNEHIDPLQRVFGIVEGLQH